MELPTDKVIQFLSKKGIKAEHMPKYWPLEKIYYNIIIKKYLTLNYT